MISLTSSVCIDAPASEVWSYLARLEDISLWSEAVLEARCEGRARDGLGAERTCDLRGGVTIKERWLEWNDGRSFTYEGVGLPGVAWARNEWSVQPESGSRTLLRSRADVVLKGGPLGRLLEPLVTFQIKRVSPRALAAFKFLVENGRPALVKHARLPRGPAVC